MYAVKKQELSSIASLFDGIDDSMVVACLQGYQGDAFVDSVSDPTVGLIVSGEYSFFGGDPSSAVASELVDTLFKYVKGDSTVAIFADDNPLWEKTLLANRRNKPTSVPRFGIVQKDYDFDIPMLESIRDSLSPDFELKPFDADLYAQAMREEWSAEFCETFASAEDYLEKGFGFAVVKDGALISATSTMTVYDGGSEIQVATRADFRKRGLAIVSAAAFIIECTKRKIRPCWDAANEASLHMALKLGYEYKGEYTTIHMTRP